MHSVAKQLFALAALVLMVALALGQDVPGACPPRREELTAGRGQTCQRPCLKDRDCSGKRHCKCDGHCGMSCVQPARSCPWPMAIDFAVTRLMNESKYFGARMKVTCLPGFKMADGQAETLSRCQGDRKWSLTAPCEEALDTPVSCGLPARIENGYYTGSSFRAGSSVQYFCKDGYALEGAAVSTCQENTEWTPAAPTCKEIFCSPPGEIVNGFLVAVQKPRFQVSEVIYYLCKRTFLMTGSHKVFCQSNGQWTEKPACRDRCKIEAQRSRVLYKGKKVWISEITDRLVHHLETVTFFCRNQTSTSCNYPALSQCFDGVLPMPACYVEPTWLQYNLYPKKVVSEIAAC